MPFISLRRSREAVFRRPVVLGQGCQSQVTVVCSSANFFLFEQFHEMLLFSLMNDIYKRMPKRTAELILNLPLFHLLNSNVEIKSKKNPFFIALVVFFIFRPECLTSNYAPDYSVDYLACLSYSLA